MKIRIKLEKFESVDFNFDTPFNMRYFPQVIVSNASRKTAINLDFLRGNYHALCFFNIPITEGINEFPLVWTNQHLTNLFPECTGVHIFAHEWNPIEFDLEIPGINFVPYEFTKPPIAKKEVKIEPRQKQSRTGGIRDEAY